MSAPSAPRQIFFDTETTGLKPKEGHRIIEFAGIEAVGNVATGRVLKMRFNPDREVDPEASAVNGLTWDMLRDKPRFRESADELIEFIRGAELIAYNAPFDADFMQSEFDRMGYPQTIWEVAHKITDALALARGVLKKEKLRNMKLDTLIAHYGIDASDRLERHDALIDSRLLLEVHTRLIQGLDLSGPGLEENVPRSPIVRVNRPVSLPTVAASTQSQEAHTQFLAGILAQEKVEPVGFRKAAVGPRP